LVYYNRIVSNIFVGPILSFKVTFNFVLKLGYNVAPLRKNLDPPRKKSWIRHWVIVVIVIQKINFT